MSSVRAPGGCGFTIIELMVTISLLSVFIAAVYESVLVGLRAVNAADEREDIRLQLARAVDFFTREASLASNIDVADNQQFQFDADLDGNGTTESDINYRVSGGDLQRVYDGVPVTLAGDLTSLDFDYTDLNGTSLTTLPVSGYSLDLLRLVQLAVSATKDSETLSLAGAAYLRNDQ